MKVNSIFAPVMAVSDQLESPASQGMMGMGDLKSTVLTVTMRCS